MGIMDTNKMMPIVGTVILVIIVIYIIVYLIKQYKKYHSAHKLLINQPRDATKRLVISGKQLPKFDEGYEYTYSFWIFISDWQYKYGHPKPILYKGDKEGMHANPCVWLYPKENKLMVRFDNYTYGNQRLTPEKMNPIKYPEILEKDYVCDVENIPLQKWVHVGVVLWNRTTDVYIDGKLVRSCILPGVPRINNEKLYVTPQGGFHGNISRLLVVNKAYNPYAIYNEYLKGPFPYSFFSSIFGNVRIGVSVNGKDVASGNLS